MSFGIRIANFVGILLFGEPIRPIQFPSENWTLSEPRIEIGANVEKLTLNVRDARYPRLRGSVSILIVSDDAAKVTSGRTFVRWRTKASGGQMAADRFVRISDGGVLRTWPMTLGLLRCNADELKMIARFLEKQVRPDRDEEDPLVVTVPVGPLRPSGGLSSEALP